MKTNAISLLTLAVFGATLLIPRTEARSQDEEKKAEGKSEGIVLPMPPMSPIPRPENAKLDIISPKDGDTVPKTFKVQFGLEGMGVAPAGVYLGEDAPTGHHHIVLDAELPNLELPFPMDENYLHFGGGQTETTLTLEPGEHTLQLVLGDHAHIPHDPPLISEKITITVEE